MSRWTRLRLQALIGIGGAALLMAIVGKLVTGPPDHGYAGEFAWIGLGVLPLYVVAVWLVRRRPDHPQSARLLLMACSLTAGSAIDVLVQAAHRTNDVVSWLWAATLASQFAAALTVISAATLLASYPDGTVEQRWQRLVLRALWALLTIPPLLLLASPTLVIDPFLLNPPPQVPNPAALPWLAGLAPPLAAVLQSNLAGVAALPILATRYRQATPEQRLRMRPLVFALGLGVSALVAQNVARAAGLPPTSSYDWVFNIFYLTVVLMIPVSIVLGVLRYRLFDIDLVIRRSVVYGVLSLGIAAVYIGAAAAPGLALGSQIPAELAVVLTIIAAVAFQPVRRRLEALADRWVFGARVNRYKLLTTFGASLEQTIELPELLPTLADTIRRGLAASWARVSLPDLSATAGEPTGVAALTVPLERSGQTVGQIECGAKHGGYEPVDLELLTTLAGQAATAIANVQLTAELAERLHELARSRARIIAAQDTERRRIERDLHDGAQQHVVALIMKLRLARNQLGRGERSAEDVLGELQTDTRQLLADLRDLAHGIHPPVLSDRGLVAAVEARADRQPLDVAVHAEPALREQRLGSDVEVAAYFTVCEALTNIVKHAHTNQAQIALSTVNGHLEIVVSDNGTGYTATQGGGHGLTNLRDRVEALGGSLHVEGHPGAGTSVRVELPVGAPDG